MEVLARLRWLNGSGISRARLLARRLQAVDTYGGPLLGRPWWDCGRWATNN
jgi:hypothetical protein